jgi:hypothetical protein
MDTTERVLVIFLSAALAIFLVLGITVLIFVIQIVRRVKRITEKAEHLADKAESVGEFLRRAAGPLAISRIVAMASEVFFGRKRKKSRRRKNDDA